MPRWIACEDLTEDALLHQLGWRRTGQTEVEHHGPGMIVLRRQSWTILFGDGRDYFMEFDATDAAACSAEALTGFRHDRPQADAGFHVVVRGRA